MKFKYRNRPDCLSLKQRQEMEQWLNDPSSKVRQELKRVEDQIAPKMEQIRPWVKLDPSGNTLIATNPQTAEVRIAVEALKDGSRLMDPRNVFLTREQDNWLLALRIVVLQLRENRS